MGNNYLEKRLEKFDEDFPCIQTDCDNNGLIYGYDGNGELEQQQCQYCYENRLPQKSFISTSIAQAELEVVKAMMMEGRESKMTPFQTTVNQYLRNRAEEIGIDISSLDKQ